jgi:hypothetical protein
MQYTFFSFCLAKYKEKAGKLYFSIYFLLYGATLTKMKIKFFLIYKEIQSGAVAKSYMRKGFLIYEEMRKYFPIYEEAVSHICSILNFLIYKEN